MAKDRFELVSEFTPTGDQPAAIDALVQGVRSGQRFQTLMGVTGSGKTFSMANVIAQVNKPTLVISHNKTLAAQLYEEFKELFPHNAVCYFVSYYDYYQPEAYIPQRDIYIEKDASRNDDLDRLRLAATTHLVSRRDVIVVASVSCIFGLGSPDAYKKSVISLAKGQTLNRREFFLSLNQLQYQRSDVELKRGSYRVRGDVIELHQAGDEFACRIEMFGDTVEAIQLIHPVSGELLAEENVLFVFPAVHYVVPEDQVAKAAEAIGQELQMRLLQLKGEGKLLEAQRLEARTKYDVEMIQEVGFCPGIENYARHLDGRPAGAKPYTLLDYFPDATGGSYEGGYVDGSRADVPPAPTRNQPTAGDPRGDWLLFIDESHVTIPQMRAMYHGDRNRKQVLVDHGFRLPSAMDNRPLRFEEIEQVWPQVVFVSATPAPYELQKSSGVVVEQVIRPTGLVDPDIQVVSASKQVGDLIERAKERAAHGERTLVITLTKRLAEDLTTYMAEQGLRCRYMHADIQTLDRVEILRDLRSGTFDVLVGVNLLREGLDLPEVSLVAIMDADKAGFLRSTTSLIQQIGRSARNVNATVVLYADTVTPAMRQAMDETLRRRRLQLDFNAAHGITPQTIQKEIRRGMELEIKARRTAQEAIHADEEEFEVTELIAELEKEMLQAAESLAFEKAAALRDRIMELKSTPDLGKTTRGALEENSKPPPGSPGTKVIKPRKTKRR
ncbi:MAG: excinuclease ABC subunit UvrB [Phycisphaeraceae bacterium]|nr:excinuclease ABC subunit UvrB [Phycisphaeraceae bacterium]